MNAATMKRTIFDSICFAYLLAVAIVWVIQPGEQAALALGRNSLIAGGLLILGAAASAVINGSGRRTLGELIFEPAHRKAQHVPVSWIKTFWGWQLILAFSVTVIVGLNQTQFSFYELTDSMGFAGALRLFQGLLAPNFNILPLAVVTIIETIFIAFMATVIAVPVAFLLSFACSKNIMSHPVAFGTYAVLRTLLNIARSIEPLIWAIIFSVWVGIGPFAGMLALMLHSVASLAKQYSETVESVNEGPIEGIKATGANFIQVIWFAIVPQVTLLHVSNTIFRWDINVRMATIIGLVGGGGIGTMLIKYQGQAMWPEVGCIILVIAVVVWLMDTASAYIREAIK